MQQRTERHDVENAKKKGQHVAAPSHTLTESVST
jgi:hypothetical protein